MGNFLSGAVAVNNYELATTSVPLYLSSHITKPISPAPEVKQFDQHEQIPLAFELYLKDQEEKSGSTWYEPKPAKRLSFRPAKKLNVLRPEYKQPDPVHDSDMFLQQKSCLLDQQKQLRQKLRQPVKRAFYKISTM